MRYQSNPVKQLRGTFSVPGDKSISHRSIMLGSIAEGNTHITGFLPGEDNLATMRIMQALGVQIDQITETELLVHGVGMHGLKAPDNPLDCGNAGTAMRLMTGLLAGQSFDSILTGDRYLLKRPMRRVTNPLALMGAKMQLEADGTAPIVIEGDQSLSGITFDMPVASAQVKSCLLLAGMYAAGETSVIEHHISRDHTERMLRAMDYPVQQDDLTVKLTGGHKLKGCDITVPADISSAAFFMVAASIHPDAEITLQNVGVNPTRDGVIRILKMMGANIEITNERLCGDEPVADITVRSASLKGIEIPVEYVPLAIDEFPVLMVAAACASGKTVLKGAKELRVKETDRIAATANGLKALSIEVDVFEDGMTVIGGQFSGGQVNSEGDHRIAMAFSIAGLVANSAVEVLDCDNVQTSFPSFFDLLATTVKN